MAAPRFRLCLILTRELCRRDPIAVLRASLRGGVDLVQIREKDMLPRDLLAWTRAARAICQIRGVPLVVNDSVEVAAAAEADGVHLGQEDLTPAQARAILGPGKLIGWSTRSFDQVEQAAREGIVDYVGFGPAFPTATKGYATGLGPELVRRAAARAAELSLPLLAIGGITVENRGELGEETGLAVSSALCQAEDSAAIARLLLA